MAKPSPVSKVGLSTQKAVHAEERPCIYKDTTQTHKNQVQCRTSHEEMLLTTPWNPELQPCTCNHAQRYNLTSGMRYTWTPNGDRLQRQYQSKRYYPGLLRWPPATMVSCTCFSTLSRGSKTAHTPPCAYVVQPSSAVALVITATRPNSAT